MGVNGPLIGSYGAAIWKAWRGKPCRGHDRWLLAQASRAGKLKGRRGNSHLPPALDLALARPIVTAELLAQELKVSARAGQNLIAELGLRELTGRRRYRAWGIL